MSHSSSDLAVPSRSARTETKDSGKRHPILVWLLIAIFVLEYIRPPGLHALHLPIFISLVFITLWLYSPDRAWSRNLTLQASFIVTGAAMLPFAFNYYEVYHGTRVLFSYFVTALAITWLLDKRTDFRLAAWGWVAIICVQAAWAIAHEGQGHGGFLNDENDLALACVTALPFGICGVQFLKGWRRPACALMAILLLAGIVASFSRGGFVGLAAMIVYLFVSGRHRIRKLLVAALAAALFFVVVPSEYTREISTIRETRSGTAETRLFLWNAAARMWMDHPLFGVGPYNASYMIGLYQPGATEGGLFTGLHFTDRDWTGKALHSMYLELLAERGIVGTVLFGWITVGHFAILRRLRRDVRTLKRPGLSREATLFALSLEAAMFGFLAAGAFLSMLTYPYFWMFSAFAVAWDRAVRRELGAPEAAARPPGRAAGLGDRSR